MIRRVLNKLGVYRTYKLKLENINFRIPIHKGLGFANFTDSEPWMNDLLKIFGSNKTRFLDVGVNVGQTLLKWKALFPSSNYIGFEPNVDCINYVKDLIKKNEIEGCTLYDYALDTEVADKKLFISRRDKSDSTATIIENFRVNENRKSIQIKTTSLKHLNLSTFDLVKIDVEGFESFVLKSIFEVNQNSIIICEILPIYDNTNMERFNRQLEIENILAQHCYRMFRLIKSKPIKIREIDEIGIHGNMEDCDYIFVPALEIHKLSDLLN